MDNATVRIIIDLGARVHELEEQIERNRHQMKLAMGLDIKDPLKFERAFPRLAETLEEQTKED